MHEEVKEEKPAVQVPRVQKTAPIQEEVKEEMPVAGVTTIQESTPPSDDNWIAHQAQPVEEEMIKEETVKTLEEQVVVITQPATAQPSTVIEETPASVVEESHITDSSRNGYKIVIMFSRYELVNGHPLFQRFPDLDVYTTADGNKLYMVESHDTRRAAEQRMKEKFSTSFPRAYVVGFRDGIIVD